MGFVCVFSFSSHEVVAVIVTTSFETFQFLFCCRADLRGMVRSRAACQCVSNVSFDFFFAVLMFLHISSLYGCDLSIQLYCFNRFIQSFFFARGVRRRVRARGKTSKAVCE